MSRIYTPSTGPESWKRLLAKPDLHWEPGYSAKTLAQCWEAAPGLPPEIARLFEPTLGQAELLLALPEHKVPLPGGGADSQSDVFALVGTARGLVACAIEGKVDEPFGRTIGEWLVDASPGKRQRLSYLCGLLGLTEPAPDHLRYQLLHRTASALIEAERFHASAAAMIIHSFSPTRFWFDDFAAFAKLMGAAPRPDVLVRATAVTPRPLYLGWASGDQAFRLS
jgi:hypothetical protein